MSAMKMERNGRSSAGQKSRHINIRYFFIKDRIAKGEINLVHCPTGIMVADFFTKPLQGRLFAKFRDIIMGITHFSTLTVPTTIEPRSVLDIDISEEKTSTETSNDEGDFITVTGTKRARRESCKAPRPLVSWRPTIQSDIN
jgi:hypothetical protein